MVCADPEAVKATMSETKRGQALGAKKRGWGGGMANAGTSVVLIIHVHSCLFAHTCKAHTCDVMPPTGIKVKCTIVENDFSGPIPGTWVGQTWPVCPFSRVCARACVRDRKR
jgi:hypothetical protein